MATKYLYSIFCPLWRLEQIEAVLNNFIENQDDISIEGIDERYMKSYKDRTRSICEICISSYELYDFDELWNSKFGRLLRDKLGYSLNMVRKGIYGIYKRPSTYKFKPVQDRLPKRLFLPI